MPLVAIATCREFPLLDDEDRLLIPALADLGIEAVPVVWTDDAVDWSSFDAVVLRETWDYSDDHDAFLSWARSVSEATLMLNRADLVAWNTDKRYLRELAESGIPVVPTRFLEPGDDPAEWLPEHSDPSGEVVVKPAVSCGSRDTARYSVEHDADRITEHVGRLLGEERVVMVQPYLASVDAEGETALLFFDGEYSHAIRKGQMLTRGKEGERVEGLFVQEQIDPREPQGDEHDVARRVMAAIPGETPLYARVDLIRDATGAPVLLELELTEPSLFLSHAPGSADRLASAVAARISG